MNEDPLRILVVENDPALRARLNPLLGSLPYRIEYVHNMEVLLKRLANETDPCVVIVDDATLVDARDEMIQVFREASPESKLIVLSGRRVLAKDELSTHTLGIVDWHRISDDLDNLLKAAADAVQKATSKTADVKDQASTAIFSPPSVSPHSDPDSEFAWLGELSAMLAHELSAPLDGSLRFVRMIRDQVESPERVLDYIQEVEQALGRMARLTRSMLAYSRTINAPRPPRPLREMLSGAERQVRSFVTRDGLESECLGDSDPLVASGLFQVFTNLIRNAFDAMPEGGSLTVSWQIRQGTCDIFFDNEGTPISSEVRERAFEPFFTTKPFGDGSGLGLSICRRLVHSLGGTIRFDESKIQGTRVHVQVPVSEKGP